MPNPFSMRIGLLAAAAAGVLWVLPGHASAQYRVGAEGHALDANNRVGSGGYNGGGQGGDPSAKVTPNDIVYKNVTGLGSFQGIVSTRDPFAFRGIESFRPSQVLEQISGASTTSGRSPDRAPEVFYRDTRAVAPPPGTREAGFSGGYVAAPPPTRQPQDLRLGETLDIPPTLLPRPDEAVGAGQVDPTTYQSPSLLSNSPLYGLRELSLQPDSSGSFNGTANSLRGPAGSRLSEDEILRLRRDLNRNILPNENGPTQGGEQNQPQNQPINSAVAPGALPSAAVRNRPLSGASLLTTPELSSQAAVGAGGRPPASGDMSTGQFSRQVLPPLPPPSSQSPQYAELRRRLAQFQDAHPKTDEEANRLFQAQLRARRQYEQNAGAAPSGVVPGGGGRSVGGLRSPATPNGSGEPVAPVKVGPIGQDIRAPGLGELVKQGEALARQQHFKEAIAKFRDARAVAPNNPLIAIDLANAEIGAGFYKEAEQDLRDAFLADPALLMGQYDLKSLIGEDRQQILIGDLKRIASTGKSPTPVFLLAYLSYNTGDAAKAVEYLDLAESRAGGQDEVIRSLRDHWALPAQGGATTKPVEINK